MAISSPEEASPRTGRDGRRSGGDGHDAVRLERDPPIRTRNTTTRSEIENLAATGGRPGRAAAGRTAGPPATPSEAATPHSLCLCPESLRRLSRWRLVGWTGHMLENSAYGPSPRRRGSGSMLTHALMAVRSEERR